MGMKVGIFQKRILFQLLEDARRIQAELKSEGYETELSELKLTPKAPVVPLAKVGFIAHVGGRFVKLTNRGINFAVKREVRHDADVSGL